MPGQKKHVKPPTTTSAAVEEAKSKAPKKKAPAKRAASKKAPPKRKDQQVIVIKTENVSVRDLNVFHKNPNTGNIDLIARSLHLNGLFRPIVVNIGTYTGRPMEILAGNHTYLAARKPLFWKAGKQTYDKPAWDTILCSFVDVDDDRAAQIVAVDNKAAQEGKIDDEALYAMFKDMPDLNLGAAGYTDAEFEDMVEKFEPPELDIPDIDTGGDDDDDDGPSIKPPKFDETDIGDEDEASDDAPTVRDRAQKERDEDDEDGEDPEGAGIEIADSETELTGAFALKDPDGLYFDGSGYYNIPKLRKDALAQPEDIPGTLTTWAGSATKYDDDPDTWWFYNFGVDSTSGMKDVSKVIMSFYTFDWYFEPWWFGPQQYVAKVINSGIKMILTPDFTDDTIAGRGYCIWQLYRQRWLGRYFQEAGLKVIPNISWPDGDIEYLKDITLPTLPKNIPVIAIQSQTYSPKLDDAHKDAIALELQTVMDTIKPKMVLLYAGQPGFDFWNERIKTDAEVRFLVTRQTKLSEDRKGRKRKTTI